jgi:single-stranded-DNA-specific exonuclease
LAVWKYRRIDPDQAKDLQEALQVSPAVGRLLAARGFRDVQDVQAFLQASLTDLSDPYLIPGMGAAVEALDGAMQAGKNIVIYGDYDVDGICGSVLMQQALSWLGCRASIYIPSRLKEGYGMNEGALQELKSRGADLVLTVDNGISAADLIDRFSGEGLEFLVTDHHQLPEKLPDCILVNPLFCPESASAHGLCGCGTAYFLAMALLIRLKPDLYDQAHRRALLDLAALATVADQVPLQGDNRILVKEGLDVINEGLRPGLAALKDLVAGQDQVDCGHVGFRLAPCINASGRLDRTELAVALLSPSPEDPQQLAQELAACNEERKELERQILNEALDQLQGHIGPMDGAVVIGQNWHPGVIGIVASRLSDHFHCPAVVLTRRQADGDLFVGSARSVEGFHLFKYLQKLSPLLVNFGGHEMAAGLSLKEKDLDAFSQAFGRECAECPTMEKEKTVQLDGTLRLEEVTQDLYEDLCRLAPFGNGNEEPLFALEHQRKFLVRPVGKEGAHLKIDFETAGGDRIPAIAFRKGDYPFAEGRRYDFAVHVNENCFMGTCSLQLQVTDIQPSSCGDDDAAARLYLERGEGLVASDALDGLVDKDSFMTRVRGVSFEDRQSLCACLKEGDRLSLLRQPNNPADGNAICCMTENGDQLGYLSRQIAAQLAPLMDLGVEYGAVVLQVTGGQDKLFGVNIQVERKAAARQMPAAGQKKALQCLESQELTGLLAETLIGDDDMLPFQQAALAAVADHHHHAVVLAPTGRGKSLVYQISAGIFALRDGKMTVVVSPLRALINDQYRYLSERFASLGLIVVKGTGELSRGEREELEKAMNEDRVDVVMTTPEFFTGHKALFLNHKDRLGQIVIDEAHHMVSRRPAYRDLLAMKGELGSAVWLYLTATVPPTAAAAFLKDVGDAAFFCDDHIRDNLMIRDARHSQRKLVYLYRLLMHNDKTVCYVNSRRQAFDICRRLRELLPYQLRHSVYYYHGGLPQEIRRRIEENFREGDIQMLISTTAFGEGVHIPDIRNVVLYHPCFSLEAFNQLAGRASRDGQTGIVHLLYSERDLSLNEMIISQRAPGREDMGNMYRTIKSHAYSNDLIIEDESDRIYDKFTELDPRYDRRQWRLAVNVFGELGFLHIFQDEDTMRIEVEAHPARRSLNESRNYLEGAGERRALEEYEKIAFSGDIAHLENIIRQALYPREWTNRGVTS